MEIFIHAYIDKVRVVKSAALDGFVGNIKAQRLYKVKSCARCRAGSGNCAGIVRYFRFEKNYIKHYLIPFRYQISLLRVYFSTFFSKKMNFFEFFKICCIFDNFYLQRVP